MVMAKKTKRYAGEDMPVSSPFAAIAAKLGVRPGEDVLPQAKNSSDSGKSPGAQKAEKLPKVKSARIERARRGGKTVTVVAFCGNPDEDARSAWLNAAKKILGIGGTLEGDNVVLQGDQTQRLDLCR